MGQRNRRDIGAPAEFEPRGPGTGFIAPACNRPQRPSGTMNQQAAQVAIPALADSQHDGAAAGGAMPRDLGIARREGLGKRYVARLTKLAFIAPLLAEAIAEGRALVGVNLQMLMDGRLELAPGWSE